MKNSASLIIGSKQAIDDCCEMYLPALDVREIRKNLGMTQLEFASSFGIAIGTIRNWEQGRSSPEISMRNYLVVIKHDPEAVLNALEADERSTVH